MVYWKPLGQRSWPSNTYNSPMAYQTNLLVMNAGNYRFWDFVKIGVPLTLLMWISLTIILPILYKY